MIVVVVEATKLNRFLAALQLSLHVAVLRTIAGLEPTTAVGPQLSLGSETKRSLDQRGHESSSNRTDRRNLSQQLCRAMFAALLHQISSYQSMQSSQGIELLVEELGPTPHPNFLNLVQPFRTVARGIDRCAGTSNGPASIECLDSIHSMRDINPHLAFSVSFLTSLKKHPLYARSWEAMAVSQREGRNKWCQAKHAHMSAIVCTSELGNLMNLTSSNAEGHSFGVIIDRRARCAQVCNNILTYCVRCVIEFSMTTPAKREALLASGTLNPHPEAVRSALFDMDFFDPYDFAQVKYEMLRAHSVDEDPVAEGVPPIRP